MGMNSKNIVYYETIENFRKDWETGNFMTEMEKGAKAACISARPSEKDSWDANGRAIYLLTRKINNGAYIAFEYKCPNGGRVDCMLFGKGEDGKENIILLELKQWSNASVTQEYETGVFVENNVSAFVNGGYKYCSHPSMQVAGYKSNMLGHIKALENGDIDVYGYAYCYNYRNIPSLNSDLFAPQYDDIRGNCPLFCIDDIGNFSDILCNLLANGNGGIVFDKLVKSEIKPTRNLMLAAADMLEGKPEFVLLDEQETSANAILAMIDKVSKNPDKKMVLVVKGGPGTGKTVIALNVLAALAKKCKDEGVDKTFVYTTRSTALRDTLKDKIVNVRTANGVGADELIKWIYEFKPALYGEGDIDVLLVDESHRIGNSSNHFTDRGTTTYLPQTISLLYCAKVCVFFIDDHQAIGSNEIGLSGDIVKTAENYFSEIENATKKAEKELAKAEKKLVANNFSSVEKKTETENKVEALKRQLSGEINARVKEVDTKTIELTSQFRCNGSDNFLDWLDVVLYEGKQEVINKNVRIGDTYEFGVCDSPAELEKIIKSKDQLSKGILDGDVARISAGWCWEWDTRHQLDSNGDLKKEVKIGDWAMPWETKQRPHRAPYKDMYAPNTELWASHPMGVNQLGCIYTAQGFEYDYAGVILGPDIRFNTTTQKIEIVEGVTYPRNSFGGKADTYIRNIYRVLMSRGKKGCYIYCCDKALNDYFKELIANDNMVSDMGVRQ